MPRPVSDEAIRVLENLEIEGYVARIVGKLDRKLYVEVNKALEAVGGKWNRGKRGHVFPGDPREDIDQIVLTGEFADHRKDFGWFPTPEAVARRLVEAADVRPGHTVLEPSCGEGAILAHVPDGCALAVCEVDPGRMGRALGGLLGRRMHIAFQSWDFLAVDPDQVADRVRVDRVVMNPPFAKQADVRHVLHAMRFLRPGGRLAAIMSAGVEYRTDYDTRVLLETVVKHGGSIERLPEGSFASSGTNVRTVLVTVPG